MQPLSLVTQSGCFKPTACHQLLEWSTETAVGIQKSSIKINPTWNLPELLELACYSFVNISLVFEMTHLKLINILALLT